MNLKTRARSMAMRHFASAAYLEKLRDKARKQRIDQGDPPAVLYFHQVDDPYSHLAVQKLDRLKARYHIAFKHHLTTAADAEYQGSAAHYNQWALRDALAVAPDYGTQFAPALDTPTAANVNLANRVLTAHLDQNDFATAAIQVGEALWGNKSIAPIASSSDCERAVATGNQLRERLGHYQGGMFYFEGEWFWGIDRIRLLEQRLAAEGFDSASGASCVSEPDAEPMAGKSAAGVLLEYFPSLRSPYTAIGHQRVLDLIATTGVEVQVKPVMPMLMRGIPAPRAKQRYIITDAAREGRQCGAPFGRIVDPFGEPVKRAFSLFPGAQAQGRALEFVTAYLNAAWFEGIDITGDAGLSQVAARAGLDWSALQDSSQVTDWQTLLTDNLSQLTEQSLWGVPSFRVSGGSRSSTYACWGQDRIWRVASEIARRASN